jgi:hypothetical protein
MTDRAGRAVREDAKTIEQFHLAFLEVAVVRLPVAEFALKGGANMRFFFRSPRRSADIDLNYLGGRLANFASRVDEVFESRALAEMLRQHDIALVDPRRDKQTDTTRRWKLSLTSARVRNASSKVEFSARREPVHDVELRAIDPDLARRLGARSVPVNRYGPVGMTTQKIDALRHRSETQPRDVFDLDHLLRLHPNALSDAPVDAAALEDASARASALTYQEYRTTVVDYLDEDTADVLGTEDAWTGMKIRVVEALETRWAEVSP